jgi:hypothetical protein
MKGEPNLHVYEMILQTWSAQVDSYWQRTTYFAAFEIAAIGGTWEVFHDKDFGAGVLFWVLGVLLTFVWLYNNLKTHAYLLYWWESLKEIENTVTGPTTKYALHYDKRRNNFGLCELKWLPYSMVTNWLMPILFLAGWIGLLLLR